MLLQGLGFLGGRSGYMVRESPSSKGRADMVIELETLIYIIELKHQSSGKAALEQIKSNQHHAPYLLREKEFVLLGINFNQAIRAIDSWAYEICNEQVSE